MQDEATRVSGDRAAEDKTQVVVISRDAGPTGDDAGAGVATVKWRLVDSSSTMSRREAEDTADVRSGRIPR